MMTWCDLWLTIVILESVANSNSNVICRRYLDICKAFLIPPFVTYSFYFNFAVFCPGNFVLVNEQALCPLIWGIWGRGVFLIFLGLTSLEDLQLSLITKNTEIRWGVARGSWEKKWDQLLSRYYLSFWCNENVLDLMVLVAEIVNTLKTTALKWLKWWTLHYMNYISWKKES